MGVLLAGELRGPDAAIDMVGVEALLPQCYDLNVCVPSKLIC